MTPHELHVKARAIYCEILKAKGIAFEGIKDSRKKGCDLLVNGLLVVVSGSITHRRQHTTRIHEVRYYYVGDAHLFNFHRRRQLIQCDVFACVALQPDDIGELSILNIPQTVTEGKTLTLWAGKPCVRRYRPYVDNWDVLSSLTPATDTEKMLREWQEADERKSKERERIELERRARIESGQLVNHGASVHYIAYRAVRTDLLRRRISFQELRGETGSPYFVTADGVTILVHGAFLAERCSSQGRKQGLYEYRYPAWKFSLSSRPTVANRGRGVVICVPLRQGPGKTPGRFVIPWSKIGGGTFEVRDRDGRYRGKYAKFRERWDIIAKPTRRKAA